MKAGIKKNKARNDRSQRGFSLIEVLVAISILVIAITGPMVTASRSISQSRFASEEITAFYLAQEGLEYIHLTRDSNFISGVNWLTDFSSAGHDCAANSCTIDPTQPSSSGIVQCSGACPVLNFNATTGFYGYSSGVGWAPSIYTRSVRVSAISSDEELVTCTVTWKEGNIPRSFALSERLQRWYPGS